MLTFIHTKSGISTCNPSDIKEKNKLYTQDQNPEIKKDAIAASICNY
jgi:hypothetical protein